MTTELGASPEAVVDGHKSAISGSAPAEGEKAKVKDRDQKPKIEPRPFRLWQRAFDVNEYWSARRGFLPEEQRAEAWKETANIVKAYSDDMIDRWNKEIDTLLVYAGLFSAILTAFNVQSYPLLTPPPATDPVILALEAISAQLRSFSINPPFVNSTQLAFVHRDPTLPVAPQWATFLNALWFSSLILSLSAASIGIMVKQWLNEYSSGVSGTSRQAARLRQLRLNSLQRWRVKEVVNVLPVLLQTASALFFAGLLVLLWQLNDAVAIVSTALVGLLAVFSLTTIILPSITTHCSYLSPPSRALYELSRPIPKALYSIRYHICSWILQRHNLTSLQHLRSWPAAWTWKFQVEHPYIHGLYKLLCPSVSPGISTLTWRGRELSLLSSRSQELESDMVVTAYTAAMDPEYLRHAAACTTELQLDAARRCFQAIWTANLAHWGDPDRHCEQMRAVHPCMWSGVFVSLMHISDDDAGWPPSVLAAALRGAARSMCLQHLDDVPRTRLVCADLARIIPQYHFQLAPGSPSMKRGLSYLQVIFPDIMHGTAVMKLTLGNDVREYVASTFIDKAIEGLDRSTFGDKAGYSLVAFENILNCIASCVPPPGSPDCNPDDPDYQRLRASLDRLSDAVVVFLSNSLTQAKQTVGYSDTTGRVDAILGWLLGYQERTGLKSLELLGAATSYLEVYQREHGAGLLGSDDRWGSYLEDFTRRLANSSGQASMRQICNEDTAIMALTLRRTERFFPVNAASLTDDESIRQFLITLAFIIGRLRPRTREFTGWKADDEVHNAFRERLDNALSTFTQFLPTALGKEHARRINRVCAKLCGYRLGEKAGLLSAELRQAIIRYEDAFQKEHKMLPWPLGSRYTAPIVQRWVEDLKRGRNNSGEDADAVQVATIPAHANDRSPVGLGVDALPVPTSDDKFAVSELGTTLQPVNGASPAADVDHAAKSSSVSIPPDCPQA